MEILEKEQCATVVLGGFQTDRQLLSNLPVARRKFQRLPPFFSRFDVFLLTRVNVRSDLVLFSGGRHLSQTRKRVESQFVVSPRAPIIRFRRVCSSRSGDHAFEMTFLEVAFERARMTVRWRKLAFFFLFHAGPVGMSRLTINLRYRFVQAAHRWRVL